MRILFTGGGTGGHIFPIVAVKREIESIYSSKEEYYYFPPEFEFVGGGKIKEKETLEKEGLSIKRIISTKWRRYFSFKNFIDIFKFPLSFFQALFYAWLFMPDVIFSKGGPGSLPVVIAGWLYQIPAVVHESDSIPSFVNKVSSPFSKIIGISFEESKDYFPKRKVMTVGHPIRQKLLSGNKKRAKATFNLTGERKIILILGGSQGAQEINSVFVDAIYKYIEQYEIIHVCGPDNFKDMDLLTKGVLRDPQRKFYHLYPYLDEEKLGDAYAIADAIISRAGAGMIFEIAAVQKPSVIIPLRLAAQNHQAKNAHYFSRRGCGTVIEETNVTPNFVFGRVSQIVEIESIIEQMKEACRKFAKVDAAKNIANTLLRLA